jgi:hypothetical protein
VRALDYFQRALRLDANSGGTEGTVLGNIRRRLIDALDPPVLQPGQTPLVPGFRETLAAYRTGRAGPEALEAGRNMAMNLGSNVTRETLRNYDAMPEAQASLFRIGFLDNLMTRVGQPGHSRDIAAQFDTDNTQTMIHRIFPNDRPETRGVAARIIRQMRELSTTSQTRNDILAGSRTEPLKRDIDNIMGGAEMAADIATLRPWSAWRAGRDRLAYLIGKQQGSALADVGTEMRPQVLLPYLNRMSGIGAERNAQNATMSMLSGYAGPAAVGTNPYGEQRNSSDAVARSVRDQISKIPGAKVRYDSSIGGLVIQ